MAVLQGDNALEFFAPLHVQDEFVKLYFDDLTQSQVRCATSSFIVRVSCTNEEAFQKINASDHEVEPGCRLTPVLSDSAPLLSKFPGPDGITENSSLVFLSLHLESRAHITKYCLEDLKTFLKDPRYILHCTPAPGELLLEFKGPASERSDQLVVHRIYEYADRFSTAIVKVSEPIADERLRSLLDVRPNVDMSCIKISQLGEDHFYMITGKKTDMSTLHRWLPGGTSVRQLFDEPITATAGSEHNSTAGDLLECGTVSARTEMLKLIEPQREVTSIETTRVQSRDVAQCKDRESSSSDRAQRAFDHDPPPTDTLDADRQKSQPIAQVHPHAECQIGLRNSPNCTFCNESALALGPNRHPQQQEQDFRRTQGNQQSNRQGLESSSEACNLTDVQVMERWLAEQKSSGTPQGWVNLSRSSTMEEQQERKSDEREIETWLENQRRVGTKPGKVILRKEGVRSAVGDDAVPQLEQRRKFKDEEQTDEQKSERYQGDNQASTYASKHPPASLSEDGSADSVRESAV